MGCRHGAARLSDGTSAGGTEANRPVHGVSVRELWGLSLDQAIDKLYLAGLDAWIADLCGEEPDKARRADLRARYFGISVPKTGRTLDDPLWWRVHNPRRVQHDAEVGLRQAADRLPYVGAALRCLEGAFARVITDYREERLRLTGIPRRDDALSSYRRENLPLGVFEQGDWIFERNGSRAMMLDAQGGPRRDGFGYAAVRVEPPHAPAESDRAETPTALAQSVSPPLSILPTEEISIVEAMDRLAEAARATDPDIWLLAVSGGEVNRGKDGRWSIFDGWRLERPVSRVFFPRDSDEALESAKANHFTESVRPLFEELRCGRRTATCERRIGDGWAAQRTPLDAEAWTEDFRLTRRGNSATFEIMEGGDWRPEARRLRLAVSIASEPIGDFTGPADHASTTSGRKPGQPSPKGEMCEAALAVLDGGGFEPGHGLIAKVIRAIRDRFQRYADDTIREHITEAVKDWERKRNS